MKKLFCLAIAALLLAPMCGFARAEMMDDQEENSMELEIGETYLLDLDGDGADETVQPRMHFTNDEENLQLLVESDGIFYTYETYIYFSEQAFAADLLGDGRIELLLCGDEASADYSTWCLTFDRERGIQPIPFADANRGENTDEYFDYGYGRIDRIDGNKITLIGSQDALGTWMCSREFTLRDGKFELEDDGIWHVAEDFEDPEMWEYRGLVATRDLPVTLEDGSAAILASGTRILVTATDKTSFVDYLTSEGDRGRLSIAPNEADGWGFLVDGRNEYDCFESIPYAD